MPIPQSSPSSAKQPKGRTRPLSVETLEQLGARRLAELLMNQSTDDRALARSLRLLLAEADGTGRLATEVEKRLRTILRSKGFVEWDKVRPLARELDGLRETITGPLAKADPHAAAVQMRLFLSLATGLFERSDDNGGSLGDVFHQAGAELGQLWGLLPNPDPVRLAEELLGLLDEDDYGVTGGLLVASGPALGPSGRSELRRLLEARLAAGGSRGRTDVGDARGRFKTLLRLRQLADVENDVDAFIAAVQAGDRVESFAGDVAERLLTADRPAEALIWLERAQNRHEGGEAQHVDLRIAALNALGRKQEAQDLRWTAFERWLSAAHLRAYLRSLPDFEDVVAEDRAFAHALAQNDRALALSFLVGWPNLRAADQLVRAHRDELNGQDYGRLRPAAEVLAEKYPVAATLLHRCLAEDVLRRASSRQYQYAVRDVRACAGLAPLLPHDVGIETHEDFMARLRREHPRKAGFWCLLEGGADRNWLK